MRAIAVTAVFGMVAMTAAVRAEAPKAEAPKIETKALELAPCKTVVPAAWKEETPKNMFRMSQFKVPKVEGDDADAEFYVSKLSGGGSVEDNVKRWVGQFTDAKGGDIAKSERGGLKIFTTEITGTFIEKKFPMDTKGTPRAGWKLLGAIVETNDGTLYIRVTGPGKTVDAHKAGFALLIDGLKQ